MSIPFNFSSYSSIAVQATLQAAEILKEGFQKPTQIFRKPGRQNYVTEYDHLSEECIIASIKKHFPNHQFLAEEGGLTTDQLNNEIIWIIDPLDGTTNFIHHIPIFTISLAAKFNREIICGVIYQPLTNELFVTEKSKGAYLNGKKLQVSSTQTIEEALISVNLPYDVQDHPIFSINQLKELTHSGASLRNLGSASLGLAYVAAGKLDGFWMNHLYAWDWAAGKLMIEEAQGQLTFYPESENLFASSTILASNETLHQKFLKCISNQN